MSIINRIAAQIINKEQSKMKKWQKKKQMHGCF
jgi:hypothetical protein